MKNKSQVLLFCYLNIIGILLFLWGCKAQQTASAHSLVDPVKQLGKPSFQILAITDLMGTLEPCGCTSKPLGGIDRLVGQIQKAKKEAPSAFVIVGDTFQGEHMASDDPNQTQIKTETLHSIFSNIPVTASTFSISDQQILEKSLPKTRSTKKAFQIGDYKIGFLGIKEQTSKNNSSMQSSVRSATQKAKNLAQELKKQGVELVVGAIVGEQRWSRMVIKKTSGIDFWIQGGLKKDKATPPIQMNNSFVLYGGRQGQGLLQIQFWERKQGTSSDWQDISSWSAQKEIENTKAEIRELETKIVKWKQQGANTENVAIQEQKLLELKKGLEYLKTKKPTSKKVFSASWIPIEKEKRSDPQTKKILDRYNTKLNAYNQKSYATTLPTPAEPGEASFVGSKKCSTCHTTEFDWWKETPHGHAYSTLERQSKEFHFECVSCHVTGYGKPGGSNITHVENLKNVGCENCHGPGSIHIKNPVGQKLPRLVPEQTCIGCHNEEHSDLFIYNSYLKAIKVPGHGLPMQSK